MRALALIPLGRTFLAQLVRQMLPLTAGVLIPDLGNHIRIE